MIIHMIVTLTLTFTYLRIGLLSLHHGYQQKKNNYSRPILYITLNKFKHIVVIFASNILDIFQKYHCNECLPHLIKLGLVNAWTEIFTDSKTELGAFFTPSAIRGLNMVWSPVRTIIYFVMFQAYRRILVEMTNFYNPPLNIPDMVNFCQIRPIRC